MDPGQTFDHYEIQSRLGAGGMGEVYLARDLRLDRLVAIKVLPASFASDEQRLKRFIHEAKVTSSLNHPNIGHLYEIGQADNATYLALEYVDGPTLSKRLAQGPLPLPELLELAAQAADALAEAHTHGVLHRDLKPDNLMIDRRGQLKVLDFGLARVDLKAGTDVSETRTQMLTDPGTVMGTPQYMSPEQALGRPLDARSDLFSFGVVLYQMATGAIPFQGNTAPEITDAILHQAPTQPVRLNPRIPPELERIILRSIEKDPALRYQTALDLRADLKRLKRDSESGQQASAPPPPPARRNGPIIAGAMVIFIALCVGAFIAIRTGPREPATPPEMTIRPILSSPTLEQHPSFSPDGKMVAYIWNGEDAANFNVYVKILDAGNALRLTNTTDRDYWPKWSPDGKYIAFQRVKGHVLQLLMLPALGGPERLLLEQPIVDLGHLLKPGFAWHPDGKRIVYATYPELGSVGLMLYDLDSGSKIRLTSPGPGAYDDSSPVFFPDGTRLAYVHYQTPSIGSLEIITLDGKSLRSYPIPTQISQIVLTPDGDSFLLTRTFAGLLRLRLDSGAISSVSQLARNLANASISVDGKRMLLEERIVDNNIWHCSLPKPHVAGPVSQWIASTKIDHDPRYSATGDEILFTSTRSGNYAPWIAGRDGRNPQMVTVNGPFFGSPRWSPDSRRIVYDARTPTETVVFTVSTSGGTPLQLTSDHFENIVPSWSFDGKWVYFCSNRTGRQEIWKVPSSGGQTEQVTRNGGFDSQESSDGKYLYYSRSRQDTLLYRSTPGGTEELLLSDLAGRNWVAGKYGVYYVNQSQDRILYFDLAKKTSVTVLPLNKTISATAREMDLSPDGHELLWSQVDSFTSDIVLVENFRP